MLHPVVIGNDETLLTLGFLAEADRAGGFGQYGGFLGLAGLEEVRNPWKTAGNVPGLGGFLRNPGDGIPDSDVTAFLHGDDRVGGEDVVGGSTGFRERNLVLILTLKLEADLQAFVDIRSYTISTMSLLSCAWVNLSTAVLGSPFNSIRLLQRMPSNARSNHPVSPAIPLSATGESPERYPDSLRQIWTQGPRAS